MGYAEDVAERHKDYKKTQHRCNDRVEDFAKVMSGSWEEVGQNSIAAFKMIFKCLSSEAGDEPKDPYFLLQPTDPQYRQHTATKSV